jgi:hypothetical protein
MVRLTILMFLLALSIVSVPQNAFAQAMEKKSNRDADSETPSSVVEQAPEIWLHLSSGKKFEVEEVNEDADGYWYKRGNVWTFVDRTRVALVKRISKTPAKEDVPATPQAAWNLADATRVQDFFLAKFGRPIPLGAFGQSALHTLWGLDHRNGMDVSLHPDSIEGKVLIDFLRSEGIPFMAFRGAIPRVATGPHIHVGKPSPRVKF